MKDLAIWAVFPTFPVNAPSSPSPAPPSPSPAPPSPSPAPPSPGPAPPSPGPAPSSPSPAPSSPSPPVHKTAKIEPCDPVCPHPFKNLQFCVHPHQPRRPAGTPTHTRPASPAAPQAPPPTSDPPIPPPPPSKAPPTTTQAPQSNKNPGRAMLDPGHTQKSRRNYLVPRRISAFTSARASSKVGPSLSPRCQKSQPSLSIPKLCAAKSGSSKTRPSTVIRPSVPKVP